MQKGDKVKLNIEKLVYEGAGLARAGDLTVFTEDVCPGDEVLAEIISVNKNFARAKLIEVITPSPYRVKPFCALAKVCGGCSWQHVDYEEQLRQKKNIVKETVKKFTGEDIEVLDVIKSPVIKEFRHKIQYPVSQTKVSKRILTGYYKKNSHELVNIKHCPIQPQIIDEIAEFIREEALRAGVVAYDEKKHKGTLRHVIFRHSDSEGNCLVVFVVNDYKLHANIKTLAHRVFEKFDEVAGCLVNFNEKRTNVITGKMTEPVVGQEFYTEKFGDKIYRISAQSFFQVNPKSALSILETTKKMITAQKGVQTLLDAYCGVGSFGIYLGDVVKKVTFVEEFAPAARDCEYNVKANGLKDFEVLTGDAKVELEELIKAGKSFDCVILDPPRKGLAPESVDWASKLSKNLIIYVSCNPATLARDLKLFKEKGFKTEYIQPVDMFCHTYHVESVVLIKKTGLKFEVV